MTRTITTANNNAAAAAVVRPVLLARLEFASGTVFVNTTPMTITFDGDDYLGVGSFGGASKIDETADIQATSIELQLSGVQSGLVSIALQEDYQGRRATLYMGFLDEDHALVDDPLIVYKGRMDTMPIKLGKESVISLTVVSRLADLLRARVLRFNNADQQSRFPGDKGLEFVEEMVEKEIAWKAA